MHDTVLDPQQSMITGASVSLINAGSPKSRAKSLFTAVSPAMVRIRVDTPDSKKLSIEEVWPWWTLAALGT